YYADTRLLLGLLNETETQTFALGLSTGLRALWEAEEDFDFTFASPSTASLDYDLDWATGAAETFLRYRQRDVDSTTLLELDLDTPTPDDFREIREDATERRYDGGFGLQLATDSPSSYEINFAATRIDYDEEADDLAPRTTLQGDGAWILQLTPAVSGTLGATYSYFDAENPRETEIREGEVNAGVIYDPNELLRLRFGLGYANYTREETVGGVRRDVSDDSGYVLTGGLRYLFEEITLDANARLTNAAPETRLSGTLQATYPLPRGLLTGRLFQRYGGGETGDEIRVVGASIGVDREINTASRLGFDVAVARQEDLDTDDPDVDRFNFTATYSYDLTEAVTASVGYRFRSRDEEPESATSNAVFVEVGRAFESGF
ncbi:MAG TPA: hypothetical protein VEV43_12140, partial [Actinomycetota bacterium]|nr:hypothetical protein [Actinomycetota bacterium]